MRKLIPFIALVLAGCAIGAGRMPLYNPYLQVGNLEGGTNAYAGRGDLITNIPWGNITNVGYLPEWHAVSTNALGTFYLLSNPAGYIDTNGVLVIVNTSSNSLWTLFNPKQHGNLNITNWGVLPTNVLSSLQQGSVNVTNWGLIATNILTDLQDQISSLVSGPSNGITAEIATNISRAMSKDATNVLGTMAYEDTTSYLTETETRAEIDYATNHLDAGGIISGLLSPLRIAASPTIGDFLRMGDGVMGWGSLDANTIHTGLGYYPAITNFGTLFGPNVYSMNLSGVVGITDTVSIEQDGYDEITIGGGAISAWLNGSKINSGTVAPAYMGTNFYLSVTGAGTATTNHADGVTHVEIDIPSSSTAGVTSFNSRTNDVTLSSVDVTDALGFSPISSNIFNLSTNALWGAVHTKAPTNEPTLWLATLYGGTYVQGGPLRVYTEVENPGTWKIDSYGLALLPEIRSTTNFVTELRAWTYYGIQPSHLSSGATMGQVVGVGEANTFELFTPDYGKITTWLGYHPAPTNEPTLFLPTLHNPYLPTGAAVEGSLIFNETFGLAYDTGAGKLTITEDGSDDVTIGGGYVRGHLNGDDVSAGTVLPAYLGTNTLLSAGSGISISTGYTDGVHTHTISATGGSSGYWTYENAITMNSGSTNIWEDTISLDTTVLVEVEIIGVRDTGSAWEHHWRGIWTRTSGGVVNSEEYSDSSETGASPGDAQLSFVVDQTSSTMIYRIYATGDEPVTYNLDIKVRKRVVSHP